MLHNQHSKFAVPPTPAHSDTCGDTGPNASLPVSPSLLNDPAVQAAFHDLSLSFKNFDKCLDNIERIVSHKTIGRVPNFRFVEDDEPAAVTAMEPIGTVTDRVLGDVLKNMHNRQAYKPSTPWTYKVTGEIVDRRGFTLGKMDTRAAAHVVALVNEHAGVK